MATRHSTQATLALSDDKMSQSRSAQQSYMQDHVQRMHNEIESTTRKLELEKRRLNKLDEDVMRMRAEHKEKCLKPRPDAKAGSGKSQGKGPDVPVTETGRARELQKLEHRLSKAITMLNHLTHDNSEVRSKIDATRRERLQMNQVFKKLSGDISENKSKVSQLQRDTDQSRREHEERQHRITALKRQLETERRQFKNSVQQLQKDLKDREREELTLRVAATKEKTLDPEEKSKTKSLKADEEEKFDTSSVMRRILKLAFLNTIQRRHIKQHQKNIEVFEQAFATIKSTTGISDIEEIVKIFVGLEQRNFSLLNYVNTLNREIESFEKQNNELESQLEAQSSAENESDKRRNLALTDLNSQIDSMAGVTEENQVQATHHLEILDRCKPLVQTILKAVEKENRGFGGQPAPERAAAGDNVLAWLTYIEKTLTQWKDFLPESKADARNFKQANKNYKYTVGNQVLGLQAKKHDKNLPLVRPLELPSAANAFVEQGAQQRSAAAAREDESSDEEEDHHHPWTRQELRDKAVASVAKRKKHRKVEVQGAQPASQLQSGADQLQRADAAAEKAAEEGGELGYEDLVEKTAKGDGDDDSMGSDDSEDLDEVGPSEEEINEIFLKRYKMSKEELQGMADKMGIQLNNLCYLKQEFDAYDEDRSGYIDVKELKGLLEKLGEELSDEELDQAFKELDSDNSGDIEFFEFVEWFTSED